MDFPRNGGRNAAGQGDDNEQTTLPSLAGRSTLGLKADFGSGTYYGHDRPVTALNGKDLPFFGIDFLRRVAMFPVGTRPHQARGLRETPHGEADRALWREWRQTRAEPTRLARTVAC